MYIIYIRRAIPIKIRIPLSTTHIFVFPLFLFLLLIKIKLLLYLYFNSLTSIVILNKVDTNRHSTQYYIDLIILKADIILFNTIIYFTPTINCFHRIYSCKRGTLGI